MRQWISVALAMAVASSAMAMNGVVLVEDFEKANALSHWAAEGGAIVDGLNEARSFRVESKSATASVTRRLKLPVEQLRGQLVTLTATVKAEGVVKPDKHWHGVKVMLVLETSAGLQHPQIPLPTGTYDWTTFNHAVRAPSDLRSATLVLGVEKTVGVAWFDDVQIRVGRGVPLSTINGEKFRGHDLPRLRGVMHGPQYDAEDLRVLAEEWGANHIRWQLNWTPMEPAKEWARDLKRYNEWLDGALKSTDEALDACERLGIMAIVDLHCAPGGREENNVNRMFLEARYRDRFIEVWQEIARRYKGRKAVYAYDLINEPVEAPPTHRLVSWRELATDAARAIREIDPDKPIVYEPGPMGSCKGFDTLAPLDLDRVIYSFHMYKPHSFTHQGVKQSSVGVVYPGVIAGETWNKERLRDEMLPAIEFQRDTNCQMYVGEFSAARWAPGDSAYLYLADLIDLFEECEWDWSYHAYREANVWSVEYGKEQKHARPVATTKRKELLLDWFAKNERPTTD